MILKKLFKIDSKNVLMKDFHEERILFDVRDPRAFDFNEKSFCLSLGNL